MGAIRKKGSGNLLMGATVLAAASLLVKVIGVIYKIPLAHILGDDGMGYFNCAYAVYTFFFLLCSAGVPKAITILVSKGSDDKSLNHEYDILHTAAIFFFFLGLTLASVLAILSAQIAAFIGNTGARLSMLAISPAIPFISVSAVYRGYLNGRLRFGSVAISQCIEAILKLALGIILVPIFTNFTGSKEIGAALASLSISIGSLVTFLHVYINVKSLVKRKKARQNCKFSFVALKQVLEISLPVTASSAVISLVNVIDLAVIMRQLSSLGYSEFVSSVMYGNYTTLAVPMFNFALSMTTSICVSLLPLLAECERSGDGPKRGELFDGALRLVAFISVPLTVLFMLFPVEILSLLFERGSVVLGAPLLSFLSVSVALISLLTLINTALEAKGAYVAPLISMLIGCAVKLAFSYSLVGKEGMEIIGAPIGTAASYLVSLGISIVLYIHKEGKISVIAKRFIIAVINSTIAAFSVLAIKKAFIPIEQTAVHTILLLAIYGAIYIGLSLLSGIISIKQLRDMAK